MRTDIDAIEALLDAKATAQAAYEATTSRVGEPEHERLCEESCEADAAVDALNGQTMRDLCAEVRALRTAEPGLNTLMLVAEAVRKEAKDVADEMISVPADYRLVAGGLDDLDLASIVARVVGAE